MANAVKRENVSPYQISRQSVKPLLRYGNLSIFPKMTAVQKFCMRFGTIHEVYLVVFTVVQNLFGIDAVVSI